MQYNRLYINIHGDHTQRSYLIAATVRGLDVQNKRKMSKMFKSLPLLCCLELRCRNRNLQGQLVRSPANTSTTPQLSYCSYDAKRKTDTFNTASNIYAWVKTHGKWYELTSFGNHKDKDDFLEFKVEWITTEQGCYIYIAAPETDQSPLSKKLNLFFALILKRRLELQLLMTHFV